ncbi:MAG TPA: MaoC family dehydratase [Alphaproteobacteria bacterium]|nr:MaoC family dehydratase [Alphaproteobacteria bacterium]
MKVGDTFSKEVHFDAAGISAFARSTGDMNPLHHNPALAAKSRFGGIIASGSHVSALLLGMLAGWFADKPENVGLDFAIRFKAPVRDGDTVTMRWRIASIEPKASLKGDIVRAEGEAARADGVVAATATAAAAVFR